MKVYDDFVADLETLGEEKALSNLVRKNYSDTFMQDIFNEVNFYPNPKILEKVKSRRKAEKAAMKEINSFFNGLL